MICVYCFGMIFGDYVFIDFNFLLNDDYYWYSIWFKNDFDDVILREVYCYVIYVSVCSYCL